MGAQRKVQRGGGAAGKTRTGAPQNGQNEPHCHPKEARATGG
jgi:hypothetical protein